MKLYHVNTRERLTIRLYDRRGRTIRTSVRRLNRFLRCHYTNKRHRMHWRLIQRLYRISRRFKGRVIRVYSGYRARRVARSRTSRHTKGRAIDFAVTGVSTRTLRDFILTTYKTKRGLGYYPNTPFVHFDVREKSAFWVDYSGKGEEPRYSTNPFAVLRQERVARRRKRLAKKTTAPPETAAVASAKKAVEPTGPPSPVGPPSPMGPPRPPREAKPLVLEPMGPPRPPKRVKVEAEGPPPLGPSPGPTTDEPPVRPGAPKGQPRKRATTKGTRTPPTKDSSDTVSNIRGAAS